MNKKAMGLPEFILGFAGIAFLFYLIFGGFAGLGLVFSGGGIPWQLWLAIGFFGIWWLAWKKPRGG